MAGEEETSERITARRKPTILAVEDDDMCRDLLRKMLADADYTVLYACDGLEGMRHLEQAATIDVILLDGNMPRMSGSQMLAALRTSRRYRNIPVVLQTTDRDGFGHDAALMRIVKPFTEEALRAVIEDALRRASRASRSEES